MTILTDEQYDLLTFIAACNRSAYKPTTAEAMLWSDNREPREARYKTITVDPLAVNPVASLRAIADNASFAKMFSTMFADQTRWSSISPLAAAFAPHTAALGPCTRRELVKPAETIIEHLVRLTWLAEHDEEVGSPRLQLTSLGQALLYDHNQQTEPAQEVGLVVLGAEDPLAYPQLVGQLANAGEGLFVDPYLKLDGLHRIVVSTRLTRLLVSGTRNNDHVVAAIQTYLDSGSLARKVEVRSSTALHDRVLLAEDGAVFTLGTSLNGVGRKLTVLSPIPSEQAALLAASYEQMWADAELVGPSSEEDDDEQQEND